jgi:hypothetical protein
MPSIGRGRMRAWTASTLRVGAGVALVDAIAAAPKDVSDLGQRVRLARPAGGYGARLSRSRAGYLFGIRFAIDETVCGVVR